MHDAKSSSTERAQVELLLNHPEIIAWLGLSKAEVVARLERQEHDGSSRAAFVVNRFENAFELNGSGD